jgi:hypothetical protein
MSEETKAKIAATRAATRAATASGGEPAQKRATIEDQINAAQAAADAGDAGMMALMPVIDVFREKLAQAISDRKSAARKLRKLLSA